MNVDYQYITDYSCVHGQNLALSHGHHGVLRDTSHERKCMVNGRCFNQTGVIKKKKYAQLVKFHPEKNGVHARTVI